MGRWRGNGVSWKGPVVGRGMNLAAVAASLALLEASTLPTSEESLCDELSVCSVVLSAASFELPAEGAWVVAVF
jgi:hypothetical protein